MIQSNVVPLIYRIPVFKNVTKRCKIKFHGVFGHKTRISAHYVGEKSVLVEKIFLGGKTPICIVSVNSVLRCCSLILYHLYLLTWGGALIFDKLFTTVLDPFYVPLCRSWHQVLFKVARGFQGQKVLFNPFLLSRQQQLNKRKNHNFISNFSFFKNSEKLKKRFN